MRSVEHNGKLLCLFGIGFLAAPPACSPDNGGPAVIAIDVLIEPDTVMIGQATAVNARLRQHYPQGFALDASHAPHITLVQRYVRARDIEAIAAAVSTIITAEHTFPMPLTATGYGGVVWEGIGMVDFTFEPSAALGRFAEQVVAAVQPFAVSGGTGDAFQRLPGEQINAATIAYVEHFVPQSSGPNFRPHVTLGNAQPDFLKTLTAEPFRQFEFTGVDVAIYQLGNFGTAQKKLWPRN